MRVLFLTLGDCDFLSDGLLHGLRTLLGADVVDYPRQDILYDDIPAALLRRLHGRGFTLYGLLDDQPIDRVAPMQRIAAGEFDLVIVADIWQQYGVFLQLLPYLRDTRVVVLDGDDWPALFPYMRGLWRLPRYWILPRAHVRAPYYKRELTPATFGGIGRPRPLRLLPPYRRRTGCLRPIAFSIPQQKLSPTIPPKRHLFPQHIVDPEVAERVGGGVGYCFDEEAAYVEDLRGAVFGITTRRSGWDCLRHYELAASGCVLCFRALGDKPPTCAPHGLDAGNCLIYQDADDLLARIDRLDQQEVTRLQQAALAWARANTTTARARQFMASLEGSA